MRTTESIHAPGTTNASDDLAVWDALDEIDAEVTAPHPGIAALWLPGRMRAEPKFR